MRPEIVEPEVLTMYREAIKGKPGPKSEGNSVYNINELERSAGTSKSYTLDRLTAPE